MTAQIPDTLLLQDQTFSIVGVNGQGLFDPLMPGANASKEQIEEWVASTFKLGYNS